MNQSEKNSSKYSSVSDEEMLKRIHEYVDGSPNLLQIHNLVVHGLKLDQQGRCAHWHSELDVVANRFKCCGEFYACHECHQALAGHDAVPWPAGSQEPCVGCGVCGHTMTARQYLTCENQCPKCRVHFNPACKTHRNLYFSD